MTTTRIAPLACLLLLVTGSEIVAQQTTGPAPGTRVRLWYTGIRHVSSSPTDMQAGFIKLSGTLIRWDADGVLIRPNSTSHLVRVPTSLLVRAEFSRGHRTLTRETAAFGTTAGTLLGVFWGLNRAEANPVLHVVRALFESMACLALPGALLGALLGSRLTVEEWEPLPMAHFKSGRPQVQGLALQMTFSLGSSP